MSILKRISSPWSSSSNYYIMKPFFGLNNRLASILISFIIFGYAIYCIICDGILSSNFFQFVRLRTSVLRSSKGSTSVKYDFDSETAPLFGLYEIEIALIKVGVSFLLFLILLVGASQRSRILLRIWMMIHALVIIMGFLFTVVQQTDSHLNNNGTPNHTLTKFLITLAFALWFFAVVLSLHEELELGSPIVSEDPRNSIITGVNGRISRNCTYIAKTRPMERIPEEKCPPFYDC